MESSEVAGEAGAGAASTSLSRQLESGPQTVALPSDESWSAGVVMELEADQSVSIEDSSTMSDDVASTAEVADEGARRWLVAARTARDAQSARREWRAVTEAVVGIACMETERPPTVEECIRECRKCEQVVRVCVVAASSVSEQTQAALEDVGDGANRCS